jgi:hypothetical protein
VLALIRDVTLRKKQEEELKQKTDEMTRFTYTVSHDLKSPLVTIRSFLGYLQEDIETNNENADQLGIENLYKQILLLALANPRSMLRGEAERVNSILKDWTYFVDLVPINKPVTARSYFLIDAQSDEMPCAPNIWDKGEIAVGWYLVTDSLENMLDKKVTASEQYRDSLRPTDAGATILMKKLRNAWSEQIRPRELRSLTSDMIEVVCGLETIHQAHGGDELTNAGSWRPLLNKTIYNPGHHAVGSSILNNKEVLIEVEPGTLELYRFGNSAACHEPRDKQSRVEAIQCVATNKSENGYCLNWPDTGDEGTHVGELVGVKAKEGNGNISEINIGVVRWMCAEQPGFLGMGVELLSGLIEPVILQSKHKDKKYTEAIKGFLQYAKSEDSVSLIAPPFYVADEDQYRLVTKNDEIPIDITNIIESTDSFVRFRFERIPETNLVS